VSLNGGAGNDTISLSGAALTGTIAVDAQGGANQLNVSETGSSTPDTVTVTNAAISGGLNGGFTVDYVATGGTFAKGIHVTTGSVADTVNVHSTSAGGMTTIDTGKGVNVVNVGNTTHGAQDIAGPLQVQSSGGTLKLTVDDLVDTTARQPTVTASQISGLAPVTISYTSLASLTVLGSAAGSSFVVTGTPNGVTTTLKGSSATDNFGLQATGSGTGTALVLDGQGGTDNAVFGKAVNTGGILSPVRVLSGGGTFNLIVDDLTGSVVRTIAMTDTQITGLLGAGATLPALTYANLGSLVLNLGPQNASISIQATKSSDVSSLTINSNGGADSLTITNPGGSVWAPSGGIFFNGTGSNSLVLQGGGGPSFSGSYTPSTAAPANSGTCVTTNGTVTQTVSFTGAAPAMDTTAAGSFTINGTNGPDTITLANGSAAGLLKVSVNALEPIQFANKTNVIVNGLGGGDTFNIGYTQNATGLTAITFRGGAGSDTFSVTQTPTGGPTTIVDANGGTDTATIGNAGSVKGINAPVTVQNSGAAGSIALTVDDSKDASARTPTLSNTQLTGLAPALIAFSNLKVLTVNGGTGGNSFTLTNTPPGITTNLNSGTGKDKVFVQATGAGSTLTIDGQGGTDAVSLGNAGNTGAILGAVSVKNTGGTTNLTVDDGADTAGRTLTLTDTQITGLTATAITYANLGALTLNTGSGNDTASVQVAGTPAMTSLTVNANAGADTLTINNPAGTVFALTAGIFFNGGGNAGDTLILQGGGGAAFTETYTPGPATPANSGVLVTTNGAVTQTVSFTGLAPIIDTSAASTFTIKGTSAAETIGVVNGSVPGRDKVICSDAESVEFANKTKIVVNGQGGGDTFNVAYTQAATGLTTVVLHGGAGTDTFSIAKTPAGVATTADGNGGSDVATIGNAGSVLGILGSVSVLNSVASSSIALTVDGSVDTGAQSATVNAGTLTGLTPATISYANLSSLTIKGGTGGISYTVLGTPAGITTTLDGGSAADTFLVQGTGTGTGTVLVLDGKGGTDTATLSNAGSTAGIVAAVTVKNTGGTTNLTVDDSAGTGARTVTMTDTQITGLLGAGATLPAITYANLGTLTLNTGSNKDSVSVQATNSSDVTSLTVNTNGGADTLAITNPAGTLFSPSGNIFFNGGGNAGDTLVLQGGGGVAFNEIYDPTAVAPANSGIITTFGPVTQIVTFSGLLPALDTVTVSTLTINGTTAAETLGVVNGAVATRDKVTLSDAESLEFANKAKVIVNGNGGGDTFNVGFTQAATGLTDIVLHGAAGSTDTFNVTQTPAGVQTTVDGNGDSATATISNAGSVQSILGPVTVLNSGGGTSSIGLTVDDSKDATGRTATLSNTQLTGLSPATITFANLNVLTVNGGTGGNTFTVTNTPPAITTNLNTGTNNDTVFVQGTAAGTTLNIDGQGGTDSVTLGNAGSTAAILGSVNVKNTGGKTNLTVDDSADGTGRTVTLTDTQIAGLTTTAITYANLGALTLNSGSGNDAVSVQVAGTPAMTSLTVNTNAGADTLTINNPAGGLFAPTGGINFNGGGQVGDTLLLLGGGGPNFVETYTPNSNTPANSGKIVTANAAVNPTITQTVNFTGLSPIIDTSSAGTFTINDSGAATQVGVVNGSVVGRVKITLSDAESVEFANKTNVTVNGNGAGDTFSVGYSQTATGLATLTLADVGGGGTYTVTATPAGPTTVLNGQTGDSTTITTAGTPANISGPVTVNNTKLTVDDSLDATGRTVALTDTQITGLTGAAITYTNLGLLTLDTGSGADAVSVTVVNAPAMTGLIVNNKAGADVLTINNPANSLFAPTGGITYNGGGKGDGASLVLQGGGGAAFTETYTVTTNTPANAGTIKTTNGPVTQTISFTGLAPIIDTTTASTLTINDPGAATQIGVVNGGAAGRVKITLSDGESEDFANKTNVVVNAQGAGAAFSVGYSQTATGLATLTLNDVGGGASFSVTATPAGPTTVLNGKTGDNTTITTGGNPANISGPVTVNNTNLTVDDSADTTGRMVTLTDTQITGLTTAAITYTTLGTLTLLTGSGADTEFVNVVNTPAMTSLTVTSKGGADVLTINNPANTVFNPTGGISYNGGGAGNGASLVLQGGGGQSFIETYTPIKPDATHPANAGQIVTTNGTITQTITFTGLSPITDTVTVGNYTVNGNPAADGADTIFFENAANPTQLHIRIVNAVVPFEPVSFANKTNVFVDGNGGGDTFNVGYTQVSTGLAKATFNGGPDSVDKFFVTTTPAGPSTILDGQGGSDQATITNAGSVQSILGPVTVQNTGGTTNLLVDDSADAISRTATLASTTLTGLAPATITYTNLSALTVNGGTAGNVFTVASTPGAIPTVLNSGTGADKVFVQTTAPSSSLTVNGQGGLDTVSITNAGSVQGIQGAVTVTNKGGAGNLTTLTVDDSADTTARTATLGATSLVGLAPATITYDANSLSSLTVDGGSGGNAFTVTGTPVNGVATAPTILNSGTGADTTLVQATAATSTLTVNGQGGRDTVLITNGHSVQSILGAVTIGNTGGNTTNLTSLTVDDSLDAIARTATLSGTVLSGLSPATITYSNLSDLTVNGGTGGNTFTVTSTPVNGVATLPTTLNSGNGKDTVSVQTTAAASTLTINGQAGLDTVSITNAGSVQGILGPVAVGNSGGAGNLTSLTVDDSKDAAVTNSTLSSTQLTTFAPAPISYNNLSLLHVLGGSHGNIFTIASTPANGVATLPTVIDSGTGADSVFVAATTASSSLTINGDGGSDQVVIGNITVGGTMHLGVQDIAGAVAVSNTGGAGNLTALTVDDTAGPGARNATVSATQITTLAPAPISYSNLSALSILGGTHGNTFTVTGTPVNGVATLPSILDSGTGQDSTFVAATSANSSLTINGEGSNDAVTIGNVAVGGMPALGLQNIAGAVAVSNNGGAGNLTTLSLDDTGGPVARNATIGATVTTTLAPAPISYSNLSLFHVLGGTHGNIITLTGTPVNGVATLPTVLDSGAGADTTFAEAVASGSSLTIQGDAGTDTVVLGQPAPGGRTMQSFQGPSLVTNAGTPGNKTALTFDDTSDPTGRTATITVNQTTGLAPATLGYSNLSQFVVDGGPGGNHFNVQSTPGGDPPSSTINGGNGNDTFVISSSAPSTNGTLSFLGGPLTINGGGGVNTAIVSDAADTNPVPNAMLTNTQILDLGTPQPITYHMIQHLDVVLGTGNVTFTLDGDPAAGTGTDTRVIGTAGNDRFNICSTGNRTSLFGSSTFNDFAFGPNTDGMGSLQTGVIVPGTGYNRLNYVANTTGVQVNLSARTSVSYLNPSTTQAGVVTTITTPAPTPFSATGTGGIVMPAGPTPRVDVVGGAGSDVIFGGTVSSQLESGPGGNDLIVGGSGTDTILGGPGNDTLVGANGPGNKIFGNGGTNSLIAGNGNDTLVGGGMGQNTLVAGGGNDILFGGPASNDPFFNTFVNAAALPAGTGGALFGGQGPGSTTFLIGSCVEVLNQSASVTFLSSQQLNGQILLVTSNNFPNDIIEPDPLGATAANCPPVMTNVQASQGSISVAQAAQDRANVIQAIVNSAERDSDIVNSFYQQYLGRAADPVGLQVWVNALESGVRQEQVIAGIVSSAEYYAKHGGTDTGFLVGLYHDLLGRTPSQGELNGWLAALGSLGRTNAALGFLGSDEYRGDVLGLMYQNFLGRPIDPTGLSGDLAALRQGESWQQLEFALLSSAEYQQLVTKEFGDPNNGLIRGLYRDLLGRTPGQSELDAWFAALTS
jgi:Ca2+-binding RTX toxin-like protein